MQQVQELYAMLQETVLTKEVADHLHWRFHPKGTFNVKSFVCEAERRVIAVGNFVSLSKIVWKGLAPPRAELLAWFVLIGRLNTKDRLLKFNIIQGDDGLCVFCGKEEENVSHLFFTCEYSWRLWKDCLFWWQLEGVFPKEPQMFFEVWMGMVIGDFKKKMWISLFFVVVWPLWYTRNQLIFKGAISNWEMIKDMVNLRLGYWVKGWCHDFPFSASEVANHIEVVKFWKKRKNIRQALHWSPPPRNFLKLNTDGSAKGKPGKAGTGRVLRDENGEFLCIFFASMGIRDSIDAEFLAVIFALETSVQKQWVKDSNLIREVDSQNALIWALSPSYCPWELRFHWNKFQNLRSCFKSLQFVHQRREANFEADFWAKSGANGEGQ